MKPKHDKNLHGDDWDGIKIEEHKMMDKKLTSSKSRWSWKGACMKFDCKNNETEICDECFNFSEYNPITSD